MLRTGGLAGLGSGEGASRSGQVVVDGSSASMPGECPGRPTDAAHLFGKGHLEGHGPRVVHLRGLRGGGEGGVRGRPAHVSPRVVVVARRPPAAGACSCRPKGLLCSRGSGPPPSSPLPLNNSQHQEGGKRGRRQAAGGIGRPTKAIPCMKGDTSPPAHAHTHAPVSRPGLALPAVSAGRSRGPQEDGQRKGTSAVVNVPPPPPKKNQPTKPAATLHVAQLA